MQTLFIWEVRFLLDEMISQSYIYEIMIKRTFHTMAEFCETCCLRVNLNVFTKVANSNDTTSPLVPKIARIFQYVFLNHPKGHHL